MKKSGTQKGITLVALIITIVILLILAAVAIDAIQNENILSHAKNAATKYNQAVQNEQERLDEYLNYLNNNLGGSGNVDDSGNGNQGGGSTNEQVTLKQAISDDMLTRTENSQTTDIYGNIIKIPAGFKILVDSTTGYTGVTDIAVEKGIVITDGTNEFVYVPVGSIKTASETKTITLARYEFDINVEYPSTLVPSGTGAITATHTSATDQIVNPFLTSTEIDCYFVEGTIDDQDKGYALNISDFYSKASTGYYIGRYEARIGSSESTAVTTNKANAVYNAITQSDATEVCQSMYLNKPFTTDLVNSFAWDTAIAFIQSFEDTDYSLKTSVNSSISTTGTVGTETEDKVCNIYDMASNCIEWSTETCSDEDNNCTVRGGMCRIDYFTAGFRYLSFDDGTNDYYSFRPVLYL